MSDIPSTSFDPNALYDHPRDVMDWVRQSTEVLHTGYCALLMKGKLDPENEIFATPEPMRTTLPAISMVQNCQDFMDLRMQQLRHSLEVFLHLTIGLPVPSTVLPLLPLTGTLPVRIEDLNTCHVRVCMRRFRV